jgi:RNA recognition motif-containing protein
MEQGNRPLAPDGESELSFEALTFGESYSHEAEKNGAEDVAPQKKNKENKFKKKPGKKDKYSPPQSEGNSVFINATGDKLDVTMLLKKLESYGSVRAYYFKEKQNFGFVQFVDSSNVDAVIDGLNKTEFDGNYITVERAAKGTPGRGTRTSPQSTGITVGTPLTPTTQSVVFGTPTAISSTPSAEKPDTILVLKNLPFTLKQDQLQEILYSLSPSPPQSINLHYDGGMFKGMAFIKYRLLDDAIKVYEALNGLDVGGRKVRVEYKRKNNAKAGAVPPDVPVEWQEDEELRKLWEQIKEFKENASQMELIFPPSLTSPHRKHVHNMADKLKLAHYSSGEGDQRSICVAKKAQSTPANNGYNGSPHSHESARAIDIKGRRRRDSDGSRMSMSPNSGSGEQHLSRTRGKDKQFPSMGSSAPADIPSDSPNWRSLHSHSHAHTHMQPSPASRQEPTIAPIRQPKGPDGSKGFTDVYRSGRKKCVPTFVFGDAITSPVVVAEAVSAPVGSV